MVAVALQVSKFSQWLRTVMEAQRRDESHGMTHFESVRRKALEIAEKTSFIDDEERLILQLAALCHDVLDHKYSGEDDLKFSMEEALRITTNLTPEQVVDVCLISDNVSLSKELAGLMEEDALIQRRLLHLRDFVSDADKLEALGIGGLQRLAQYQMHVLRKDDRGGKQLSSEFLRTAAQEHLLHRVHYLRTETAVREGHRLLREMTCVMASDAALNLIIDQVIMKGMD